MIRERSTKTLAQRIDLDYVHLPGPGRIWMRLLCAAAPIAALLWIVVMGRLGKESIYSSGPVSASHAIFENQCGRCHLVWVPVADTRCSACHLVPDHHRKAEVFRGAPGAPRCASCHFEHRGRVRLQEVPDAVCTQCHAQLVTVSGKTEFARTISSFHHGHPDLTVRARGLPDTAQIALNHAKHLANGLKGLADFLKASGITGNAARRTAMRCTDCHQRDESGRLMRPINYERHCASCHPLVYDADIKKDGDPTQPDLAPHDTPLVIERYLLARYSEHLEKHPELLNPAPSGSGDDDDDRTRPGAPAPAATPSTPPSANDWLRAKLDGTEELLLTRNKGQCVLCHRMTVAPADSSRPPPPPALPSPSPSPSPSSPGLAPAPAAAPALTPYALRVTVAPTRIPSRWMMHARFDHSAHRAMTCVSCHETAPTSQKTSDVNLPSIALCQSCHQKGRARSDCWECHTYHDKTQQALLEGGLDVRSIDKQVPPH